MSAKLPKSKAKTAYGLLSEVATLIEAEPKRYDQGDWLSRRAEHGSAFDEKYFPPCGTVGCVAGWVATLRKGDAFHWADAGEEAQIILGLNDTQSGELFDGDAAQYKRQTRLHALSGVKHIRRFQKKYAAQLKAKRV